MVIKIARRRRRGETQDGEMDNIKSKRKLKYDCTENKNNYKVGTNHIVTDHLKWKICI